MVRHLNKMYFWTHANRLLLSLKPTQIPIDFDKKKKKLVYNLNLCFDYKRQ